MATRDAVIAGVDIGTLTCRLLVARVGRDGRLTELAGDRRILRLGDGVAEHRRLREDAMARVVDTLATWRRTIAPYRPDAEIAVATSAVRDAANAEDFCRRVKEAAGFTVDIISGEEEARRTLLGIRAGMPEGSAPILGLDIGGGSTELIRDEGDGPPTVRSMDIGVVRLSELAFRSDPPGAEERAHAERRVHEALDAIRPVFGNLQGRTLVGTAGTITTLAAMAQGLQTYRRDCIQNYVLTRQTVDRLESELFGRTRDQRRGMAGLEAGREDVILAGALILRAVMQALGFDTCLVSDYGLREGVVVELAQRIAKERMAYGV
jgi:exopolyphosphatase/guanosine-5'-triphosphate,3'-diphosphate pyrophosphatase